MFFGEGRKYRSRIAFDAAECRMWILHARLLVSELRAQGLTLELDGSGKLRLGPPGALTTGMQRQIDEYYERILVVLKDE